jgi:hypothetical protein
MEMAEKLEKSQKTEPSPEEKLLQKEKFNNNKEEKGSDFDLNRYIGVYEGIG